MKKNTIFVLLASFRDSECEKTINELFYKASKPENIYVGICWQYSNNDNFRCFDPDIKYKNNIQCEKIIYKKSKGVCWARRIAQKFWDNEEYTLVIDSHMLFEEGWDSYFISELDNCPSTKPLLSYYPAGYELPEKKSRIPPVINAAHSRVNRYKTENFISPYNIRGNMFKFDRTHWLDKPIRGFFYAAGFAFGRSNFLHEVSYDPHLDWEEEEILISVKLWTHGWDIFSPRQHYIYHLYFNNKPRSSPDFRKAASLDALKKRSLISKIRAHHLLGYRLTDNTEALEDIKDYPLGEKRSVKDFEMAAGVHLESLSATERSIDCWFALDHLNHPLRNQRKSLKEIFTEQYLSELKKNLETVSGNGSTLAATATLRHNLVKILDKYQINNILDLGCGDFNWFRSMSQNINIDRYHGVDIIDDIIDYNNKLYANDVFSFQCADITSTSFKKYDLVIIRDVLTHLKVSNVIKCLVNIKNSKAEYFLASHYISCDRSRDLNANGRWHKINLKIPPYNLPEPIELIDDIAQKGKYLAIWKTSDIPDFSGTEMVIESVSIDDRVYKIKMHLSKDECEYLSSLKYYRNIEAKFFNLDTKTDNPVLNRLFKRTKRIDPDKNTHNAYVAEIKKCDFKSISNLIESPTNATVLITLLHCNDGILDLHIDSIRQNISLHQGESIAFNNLPSCDKNQKFTASGHTNAVLLVQQLYNYNDELEERTQPDNEKDSIIFNAVGDVILASGMHRHFPKKSVKNILNGIYKLLADADINMCNLETVITNIGEMHPKQERNPYYFRSNTTLAKFLTDSHFNLVTTGNNHAMDFGGEALKFQKKYLDSMNIAHCGSGGNYTEASKPVYIRKDDTVICVISFCAVNPKSLGATNDSAGVFQIKDPTKISSTISPIINHAKKKSHLVVVSPHWLGNWTEHPGKIIRHEARKLIDNGCDAILGHSSHLLHGIEIYKNKPIIYDMACFLLDSTFRRRDLQQSALFQLVIKNKTISKLRIYPLSLHSGKVSFANEDDSRIIYSKLLSFGLPNTIQTDSTPKCLSLTFDSNFPNTPPKITSQFIDINQKKDAIPAGLKLTDLAYSNPPYRKNTFQEVKLDNNISVTDALFPESFRIGTGFSIKVIIKTDINIEDYEVVITGISDKFGKTFDDIHLFSNGAINTEIAGSRNYLVDYHFLRLNSQISTGKYKLYWRLKHIQSDEFIKPDANGNSVFLGNIYALPYGLPMMASGIDWDGNLPAFLKNKFDNEFTSKPEVDVFRYIKNRLTGNVFEEINFSLFAYEQKYKISTNKQLTYLTLSNKNKKIRWGSTRNNLMMVISRNIEKILSKKACEEILKEADSDLVIKLETITMESPVKNIATAHTDLKYSGLKLTKENRSFMLLPSEAYENKLSSFKQMLDYLLNLYSLNSTEKYTCYLIESVEHIFYQGKIYEHFEFEQNNS